MAATKDTTLSPIVSPRRAAWTRLPMCRVLQFKGGDLITPRPLLWPSICAEVDVSSLHEVDAHPATTPDVYTHFVRNAVVGGYGSHVFVDGRIVVANDAYPPYVKAYIEQDISTWHWEIKDKVHPKSTLKLRCDAVFVISHFNPIYGHWLLEIFPKLIAIRSLIASGIRVPILIPSGYCIPDFLEESIRLVVPDCEIIKFDWLNQNVFVRRAILPGMMNEGYVYNSALQATLDEIQSSFADSTSPQAVFVSRTGLEGKYRRLENAVALDELAHSMGFTVIRPEVLSWSDKLRFFSSARLIAGEYGSGMHNTIFSARGTKVVCVNLQNEIQSRIANMRRQDVGYILDPAGKAHLMEPGWREEKIYTVDLAEFEARVSPLM